MMIAKDVADEKVAEGWFRVWMAFEAFAATKETVDNALGSLLNRLDADERIKLYSKETTDVTRIENPFPNVPKIKEAFSRVCNVEIIVKRFVDLVDVVIMCGPSAIEILEPKKLSLELSEAQDMLNLVADMMHRYAAAGLGGAVLVHGKAEGKN